MKPLYQTATLISALWLPCSVSATTHAHPVEIKLQQAIDEHCDGTTSGRQLAIPGACILYTVTATNYTDETVFNVVIKGKIPAYTQLFDSLLISSNQPSSPAVVIYSATHNEPIIQQLFSRLDPGKDQSIIMEYRVKIL